MPGAVHFPCGARGQSSLHHISERPHHASLLPRPPRATLPPANHRPTWQSGHPGEHHFPSPAVGQWLSRRSSSSSPAKANPQERSSIRVSGPPHEDPAIDFSQHAGTAKTNHRPSTLAGPSCHGPAHKELSQSGQHASRGRCLARFFPRSNLTMYTLTSSLVAASALLQVGVALPAPWGPWWPHKGHGSGSSSGIKYVVHLLQAPRSQAY